MFLKIVLIKKCSLLNSGFEIVGQPHPCFIVLLRKYIIRKSRLTMTKNSKILSISLDQEKHFKPASFALYLALFLLTNEEHISIINFLINFSLKKKSVSCGGSRLTRQETKVVFLFQHRANKNTTFSLDKQGFPTHT